MTPGVVQKTVIVDGQREAQDEYIILAAGYASCTASIVISSIPLCMMQSILYLCTMYMEETLHDQRGSFGKDGSRPLWAKVVKA